MEKATSARTLIARLLFVLLASAAVLAATVLHGRSTDSLSRIKTEITDSNDTSSASVDISMNMKADMQSWAVYEDIYKDGVLVSQTLRVLNNFGDTDGGTPRKSKLTLTLTPNMSAPLSDKQNTLSFAGVGWNVSLPKASYTGSGFALGAGDTANASSRKYTLTAGDEIVLLSAVYSTAPDGSIYVYHRGHSITEVNDTVVQYRFVTSDQTMEVFL